MAKTRYYAKFGLINRAYKTSPEGFDLTKWLEQSLDTLHVPKYDTCCNETTDPVPVRYNTEDGVFEFYDTEEDTWTAVTSVTEGDIVGTSIALDDGLVSDLALKIGADTNNGIYGISDTQLGFAVEGVLVGGFNTTGLFTDSITEQTSGVGISLVKNTYQKRTATAVNVTATTTAAAIVGGLVTSTSASAVALTLPLATDLATALGAVQGTSIDFMVDNSAGSNTVTITVNTGITAVTAVVTGGATLTVASGAVGTFRIFFTSATVAKIARLI